MVKIQICHDCGAKEGQIHEYGCDMERCPFCGGQLISCDCCYEKLGIKNKLKYTEETCFLPEEVYNNGLSDSQWDEWTKILEKKGRVPYILYPNHCHRCGKLWPEMFRVSDEEWQKYVALEAQNEMLCRECYDSIKALIDKYSK